MPYKARYQSRLKTENRWSRMKSHVNLQSNDSCSMSLQLLGSFTHLVRFKLAEVCFKRTCLFMLFEGSRKRHWLTFLFVCFAVCLIVCLDIFGGNCPYSYDEVRTYTALHESKDLSGDEGALMHFIVEHIHRWQNYKEKHALVFNFASNVSSTWWF